jgi:hypothetical protein
MKAKLKGGDEWDAFTSWRKVTHWSAGQLRRIKQRFNRRIRRAERQRLKQEAPR